MSDGQKITRKLKAILSADVKGYSLLMPDDEVLTLKTLDEYMCKVINLFVIARNSSLENIRELRAKLKSFIKLIQIFS